jgi:Cytochrome P450
MVAPLALVAVGFFLASLPYWLPSAVLGLRMRIFTWINGEEGMPIPGKLVNAVQLKQLYSHPAANGRSRGAALSDLFWYWLSPGAHLHQEHLEPGEAYEEVARTTRRILSLPRKTAEDWVAECVANVVGKTVQAPTGVRLRDLMMPVWAEFYYLLVFGERCPIDARNLIVGNANDVVTALKCCSLRHMDRRYRLTRFLLAKVESGAVPHALPAHLSTREQALYLQGTFFNTAVVQMSEAMAHLLLALAKNPRVQDRLASNLDDDEYLDRVIDETLRLYPLFGIAHRIASADIRLDDRTVLPRGSVLCFNYPAYQKSGFDHAEVFDPDRWKTISPREANYIPFGVASNRPCPAQGLAPVTIRAAARELLKRFEFCSSASHTRSIPNRGPCLLLPRIGQSAPPARKLRLFAMHLRDRWEDVWRSVVQLILGTYMVWDARKLRLCERYFEAQNTSSAEPALRPLKAAPESDRAPQCPHAGRLRN